MRRLLAWVRTKGGLSRYAIQLVVLEETLTQLLTVQPEA